MTRYILKAYAEDIRIRRRDKKIQRQADQEGNRVNAHEIVPGIVYEDANVKVQAFPVNHGDVPHAFGASKQPIEPW